MRRIASIAAILLLASCAFAEGWNLKTPYKAGAKFTWNVTVAVSINGQDHEADLKQHLKVDSADEKTIRGKASWTDLNLDGNDPTNGEQMEWSLSMNPDGSLNTVQEGTDYARMLDPTLFVYPNKEVKTGDKWSAKFKPTSEAKEVSIAYEAAEETKIGDEDALKVTAKLTEKDGITADTTYWLAKDGRVLKFDANVKSWVVPMAGDQSQFDAHLKGSLAKS